VGWVFIYFILFWGEGVQYETHFEFAVHVFSVDFAPAVAVIPAQHLVSK